MLLVTTSRPMSPSTLVGPTRQPLSECLWEYIGLGESPAGSSPAPETGNSHLRSSLILLNVPEECRGNYMTRAGSNPAGSNREKNRGPVAQFGRAQFRRTFVFRNNFYGRSRECALFQLTKMPDECGWNYIVAGSSPARSNDKNHAGL